MQKHVECLISKSIRSKNAHLDSSSTFVQLSQDHSNGLRFLDFGPSAFHLLSS